MAQQHATDVEIAANVKAAAKVGRDDMERIEIEQRKWAKLAADVRLRTRNERACKIR